MSDPTPAERIEELEAVVERYRIALQRIAEDNEWPEGPTDQAIAREALDRLGKQ